MLTFTVRRPESGGHTIDLVGEPEPTEQFAVELFEPDQILRKADGQPYIDRNDGIITLRDDHDRVIRYRITGEALDGRAITGELIRS